MKQSLSIRVISRLVVATLVLTSLSHYFVEAGNDEETQYGVDVSFPIHHAWTDSTPGVSDERRQTYENYMEGCRQKWGESGARRCDSNEQDRIDMSLRQPQSMKVSCAEAHVQAEGCFRCKGSSRASSFAIYPELYVHRIHEDSRT